MRLSTPLALLCTLLCGLAVSGDDSGSAVLNEEQQTKVLELFHASAARFTDDGRLHLVYEFETMDDGLLEDWSPDPEKTKGRVRWSREYEGTPTTVEHGIIIADKGMWQHKALWDDLSMEVEYMSTSGMRRGDLVGATFTYKRGKKTVASNLGEQYMRVSNGRIASRPIPKKFPLIKSELRHRFGYELKDGVFAAQRNGRDQIDTTEDPKLLKGLTSGRAGLVWNGTIQGFVFKVTFVGDLDPAWVEKALAAD